MEAKSSIRFTENHGQWLKQGNKPYIVAGPCSAETEQQVWDSITQLPIDQIQAIRAGIWKPRTRPDSFEGIGEKGLPWLIEAAKHVNLPVMVEVATPEHLDSALKAGIDMIWIGARTTVNPFAIQALADSLRGVQIPVFVKNPINADLDLWIGALERIDRAGITKLAAIHRGFSSGKKIIYRNDPRWEIPIELKRLAPELPLLSDPSHICGRRDLLLHVAQKALDLDFDGLMIESHCNPDAAWSDAKQQITGSQLSDLLTNLICRESVSEDPILLNKLADVRFNIDQLDADLIQLLAQRMHLSEEIGRLKLENGLTIMQRNRWKDVVDDRLNKGISLGLDEEFLLHILQSIHQLSIKAQQRVFDQAESTKL